MEPCLFVRLSMCLQTRTRTERRYRILVLEVSNRELASVRALTPGHDLIIFALSVCSFVLGVLVFSNLSYVYAYLI